MLEGEILVIDIVGTERRSAAKCCNLVVNWFFYPVVFVILQQWSLLQIGSVPVSWDYNWNRRSRRECMLSWLEGRNLDLFFLKYLLPLTDFLWAPGEI